MTLDALVAWRVPQFDGAPPRREGEVEIHTSTVITRRGRVVDVGLRSFTVAPIDGITTRLLTFPLDPKPGSGWQPVVVDSDSGITRKVSAQPPPQPAEGDVWAELMETLPPDLQTLRPLCGARRAFGLGKYGGPLQRGNGRDHGADALQELLDAAVYLQAADKPEMALTALRLVRTIWYESDQYLP